MHACADLLLKRGNKLWDGCVGLCAPPKHWSTGKRRGVRRTPIQNSSPGSREAIWLFPDFSVPVTKNRMFLQALLLLYRLMTDSQWQFSTCLFHSTLIFFVFSWIFFHLFTRLGIFVRWETYIAKVFVCLSVCLLVCLFVFPNTYISGFCFPVIPLYPQIWVILEKYGQA